LKLAKLQLKYVVLPLTDSPDLVVAMQHAYIYMQKYRSQLQSATSKDEALTLAISVAESLMSALKLSSDPHEKKQLKAQCSDIMTAAGRIKNDANWKPAVEPQERTPQRLDINQWAAEVTSARSPIAGHEDNASESNVSRHGLSSTTAPVDNVSVSSGKLSNSLSFTGQRGCDQRSEPDRKATCSPVLLIDLSSDQSSSLPHFTSNALTNARHEDRPQAKWSPAMETPVLSSANVGTSPTPAPSSTHIPTTVSHEGAASASPSMASYSHIHRLAEPVSTRKRSRREDIILLKASMVNGFKCPPWEKNPSANEFIAQQDMEIFMYGNTSESLYVSNKTSVILMT
jgi:calpain-7